MQVSVNTAQNKKSGYTRAKFMRDMAIGSVVTTLYVASRAFYKENRSDEFVKTAKNCLKAYTKDNRSNYADLAKILKMDKFAKWINNVGSKKLCGAFLAGSVLVDGLFFGTILDWGKKK